MGRNPLNPSSPFPPAEYIPRSKGPKTNRSYPSQPKLSAGAEIGRSMLKVNSPYLLNTLQAVIKFSTRDILDLKNGAAVYPFRDLYYHKEDLLEYKAKEDGLRSKHSEEYNNICDKHIDQLVHYLYSQPDICFGELEADWARDVPLTNFPGVAFLLQPGSDVYVREHNRLNAYVIDHVEGGIEYSKPDSITPYTVYAWKLVFDGSEIIRAKIVISVPIFDDKRRIMALPVFPARFHDRSDNGETKRRLISRGKKYLRYCRNPAFLEYKGTGMRQGRKKVRVNFLNFNCSNHILTETL
jgi:hypothetical protein